MNRARTWTILLIGLTLAGCASAQPRSYSGLPGPLPWKNYAEAKTTFDKLIFGKTSWEEGNRLGFNPNKIPNTREILDVKKELLPGPNASVHDLEDWARACYLLGSRCQGYSFTNRTINTTGIGNTFLWIFNIRSERLTTGWELEAKIYTARRKDLRKLKMPVDEGSDDDRIIVYGLFGGIAKIENLAKTVKPLGLGQMLLDIGGHFSPVKPKVKLDSE